MHTTIQNPNAQVEPLTASHFQHGSSSKKLPRPPKVALGANFVSFEVKLPLMASIRFNQFTLGERRQERVRCDGVWRGYFGCREVSSVGKTHPRYHIYSKDQL